MISNSPGRPSELTEEVKARVLAAVPEVIIQNQIALRARIPKQTLSTWLVRGKSDKNAGIDSIYAQFSDDFYYAQTEVVKQTLDFLRCCPKNYGSLTWILEKCFREDFGADSDEMRELRELFKMILPLIGKGDANGSKEGKELHTEGNQTPGGAA